MADIKEWCGKLLEILSQQKESYHNLFMGMQDESESVNAQRAFYELISRGYIYDADGHHWYRATKAGIEAFKSGAYLTGAGRRLIEFVEDSRIIEVSEQAFDGGRLADSVFNASKMLEVAVRNKASLGPEIMGKDVITLAFHPEKGKLAFPMCETEGERQGAYQLFYGALLFLKNPESHRFTKWIDHETAVRALQTVEFLLKLVDSSILK